MRDFSISIGLMQNLQSMKTLAQQQQLTQSSASPPQSQSSQTPSSSVQPSEQASDMASGSTSLSYSTSNASTVSHLSDNYLGDTSATSTDTGISCPDVVSALETTDHLHPTLSIAERMASLSQSNRNSTTDTSSTSVTAVKPEAIPSIRNSPFLRTDTRRLQLQKVAAELLQTEQSYSNTIHLLDVQLREHITPLLPADQVHLLLNPFTPLRQLSAHFIDQFGVCLTNWKHKPKIAHVLVKFGPFLKHYGDFGSKFDSINTLFAELYKKNAGKDPSYAPIVAQLISSFFLMKFRP
jgi:hypothetical protein